MAGNSKDSKILAYKDMINQLNKTIYCAGIISVMFMIIFTVSYGGVNAIANFCLYMAARPHFQMYILHLQINDSKKLLTKDIHPKNNIF